MRDLQTLNDIEDIRALEARYARYADEKRWEDLAALFTPEGWFRVHDVDGKVLVDMKSPTEIAEVLTAVNAGDVQPIHLLLTHEIEIESPDSASAIWALSDFIFRSDDAVPEAQPGDTIPPFTSMRGWGHYHVTYRKLQDRWLIDSRWQSRTRLEFTP